MPNGHSCTGSVQCLSAACAITGACVPDCGWFGEENYEYCCWGTRPTSINNGELVACEGTGS
jgi:hypothetical protein